jgi:hypothetical protein
VAQKKKKKEKPFQVIIADGQIEVYEKDTVAEVAQFLELEDLTDVDLLSVARKSRRALAYSEDNCKQAIVLYKGKIVDLDVESKTEFLLNLPK